MRGKIEQKLKDLGIKIAYRIECDSYVLIMNNKQAHVQSDILDEYDEVGTGKFKKGYIVECEECGAGHMGKIEIMREPNQKDKIKQDKKLVKMILEMFKEK